MKAVLLLFLGTFLLHAAVPPVLLDFQKPLTYEEREATAKILYESNGWKETEAALLPLLWKELRKGGTPSEAWQDRLHWARWSGWLGNNQNQAARKFKKETLAALMAQSVLTNEFSSCVTERDSLPGAFQVLSDLQEKSLGDVGQFPSLAVALALVYDQPLPTDWPNLQIPRSALPLREKNWNELLNYFSSASRTNALLVPLKNLRAHELKFLIDAPLAIEEFQWAAKNVRVGRSSFETVFDLVPYNIARISAGAYVWPGSIPYRMENLPKQKGICVDQAYFGWIAGKAKGIPTLYFRGQGKDGGHAWFGYLKTEDRWDMNAGRYKNQKYVVGYARDPQSWADLNDHELTFLTGRVASSPAYRQSQELILLTQAKLVKPSPEDLVLALESARKLCPENPIPWRSLVQLYKTAGPEDALVPLLNAMTRQFQNDDDLKVFAQGELVNAARSSGDSRKADALTQKMMTQNRDGRTDLALKVAWQGLEAKLKSGDYESALNDYYEAIRRFESVSGGNLLYDLVQPFVNGLKEKGQIPLAKKAVQYAKDHMKTERGSLVDLGLKQLSLGL